MEWEPRGIGSVETGTVHVALATEPTSAFKAELCIGKVEDATRQLPECTLSQSVSYKLTIYFS